MAKKYISNITVENAKIIFKNFAGAQKKFNREGERNFNIVFDEEQGQELKEIGWNTRPLKDKEGNPTGEWAMKVKVRFDNVPPKIVLISSAGKQVLDETMVDQLDWARFENIDMVITPYQWNWNDKSGVTAYLKTGYFTLEEDDLDRKYADVANTEPVSTDGDIPF